MHMNPVGATVPVARASATYTNIRTYSCWRRATVDGRPYMSIEKYCA